MSDSISTVGKTLEEGFLLLKGKLFKKAIAKIEEAFELDPEASRERLLPLLDKNLKIKEYEAALTVGEILLNKGVPDRASIAVKVGNSYRHLFHLKKARSFYEDALKEDEKNELALLNLAACISNVERYDQEIKEMIKPFDGLHDIFSPDYYDKPLPWGQVLKKVGLSCRAQQMERLKKLHQLQKELMLKGENEEAEQIGQDLEKLRLNVGKPGYEELKTYLTQQILVYENRITEKKERSLWGYCTYNLALCALHNGDTKLASKSLAKLRLHKNRLDEQELLRGLVKVRRGDKRDAIEYFEDIVSKTPTNRYLNANLGVLHREQGNPLESASYFIKTAELLRLSGGIYSLHKILVKADSYFKAEMWAKALDLFLEVAKEKETVKLFSNIGHCYYRLEKHEEAIEAFLEIRSFAEDTKQGRGKLNEACDLYRDKAKLLAFAAKHHEAVTYYEYALRLSTSPKLLKEASESYQRIKQPERANELLKERDRLSMINQEGKQDKRRNLLIRKAKAKMKSGKLGAAQKYLEEAFSMNEGDKSTFLLYVTVLKTLKQPRALQIAITRFQKANDRLERITQED